MSEAAQNDKARSFLGHPATVAAVTALLTFSATMFANFKQKKWDTDAQVKLRTLSDERQVYAQIAGQKAVLLQLESEIAFTSDIFAFYQASGAGMTGAGLAENKKFLSKMFSELGSKTFDDAFQKERLIEHYRDQALTNTQQLFSAFAEARLLFSPDPTLDEFIEKIENLPELPYTPPNNVEMLRQENINAFLQARKKRADADIKHLYGQPVDELLAYLQQKIQQQQ
jgi:hypothetical protein